ncbi:hypothetical protein SISNIDRAFT_456149 [Sistotremastrum niveocremeum HHB9708]|uniref:Uncharacterized protein n=1 Tax=Sistotremastrum niveocremeum HHB9708 TaxID=1314777 RepID=A0A164T058_9AGAM|nr:hypothetical protein SISNIDRAFT_456149 [Sistotremastrum niveocremeum HHB9708]
MFCLDSLFDGDSCVDRKELSSLSRFTSLQGPSPLPVYSPTPKTKTAGGLISLTLRAIDWNSCDFYQSYLPGTIFAEPSFTDWRDALEFSELFDGSTPRPSSSSLTRQSTPSSSDDTSSSSLRRESTLRNTTSSTYRRPTPLPLSARLPHRHITSSRDNPVTISPRTLYSIEGITEPVFVPEPEPEPAVESEPEPELGPPSPSLGPIRTARSRQRYSPTTTPAVKRERAMKKSTFPPPLTKAPPSGLATLKVLPDPEKKFESFRTTSRNELLMIANERAIEASIPESWLWRPGLKKCPWSDCTYEGEESAMFRHMFSHVLLPAKLALQCSDCTQIIAARADSLQRHFKKNKGHNPNKRVREDEILKYIVELPDWYVDLVHQKIREKTEQLERKAEQKG